MEEKNQSVECTIIVGNKMLKLKSKSIPDQFRLKNVYKDKRR